MKLTQEILKQRLTYNQDTGHLVWVDCNRTDLNGTVAGNHTKQYVNIYLDRKRYPAHHLVWMYFYGYLPKQIDHIDKDSHNNKIENLREVDNNQQAANRRLFKNNKLGCKGVVKVYNKYYAAIQYNGVRNKLGSFSTLEEAKAAYENASTMIHGRYGCVK